jgi:DNA-binding transcriptional ArsR family regulator
MRTQNAIDALIPGVRQGLLRLTYGQPDRWWYLSELAAELGTRPSSLQRELESLATTGILTVRRDGRRTYYRADENNSIFPELRSIVEKTMGIARQVRAAVEPMQRKALDDQKPEEIAPSGTPEAPHPPPRQLLAMKLRPIVINMPSRRRDG